MRLKKQKEVAKENEFYIELLQKALPQETVPPPAPSLPEPEKTAAAVITNGVAVNHINSSAHQNHNLRKQDKLMNGKGNEYDAKKEKVANGIDKHELQYMEHQIIKRTSSINDYSEDDDEDESSNKTSFKSMSLSTTSNRVSSTANSNGKWNSSNSNHVNSLNIGNLPGSVNVTNSTNATKKTKNIVANNLSTVKDEHLLR